MPGNQWQGCFLRRGSTSVHTRGVLQNITHGDTSIAIEKSHLVSLLAVSASILTDFIFSLEVDEKHCMFGEHLVTSRLRKTPALSAAAGEAWH